MAGADREQAIFAALADPTRRAVLRSIASGEATTATELAARLPVSRQAVQKHLAQLASAGSSTVSGSGARRGSPRPPRRSAMRSSG